MLKPPGRVALATIMSANYHNRTIRTLTHCFYELKYVPHRLDTQISRQGIGPYKSKIRIEKNLRNDLQVEALGNPAIKYPGRSHPSLHSGHAQGFDIMGDADYQRQIISLAEEKDQTVPRSLSKRIAVGQRIFRVDHWH